MSLQRLLIFYGLFASEFVFLQVVFRITGLGCCAAGSFLEIIVWRSLMDWCISHISKKHISFYDRYSVSIFIIIIITLFIWAQKSMFAVLLCSRRGKSQIAAIYEGEVEFLADTTWIFVLDQCE